MSSKRKDLTSGMVVTREQEDCRMFMDDGCMKYVRVVTSPNPANPTEPIVKYYVGDVEIPKPDVLLPCLEPGTTQPVYVMGSCEDGADGAANLAPLLEVLNELLTEQRKDTPFDKTRYCNSITNTWWEKLCVVEKQEDGKYQLIVVSDTDTFESCAAPPTTQLSLVCVQLKNSEEPVRKAWYSGVLFEGAVQVSLFSVDGQVELDPDLFFIM